MPNDSTILITGGAGFIGSHFVERLLESGCRVVNLDLLTYAGNLDNLLAVSTHPNYRFVHGNIGDAGLVADLLDGCRPSIVFNMAAESHVDRSIDNATDFIDTNVVALHRLLEAARDHWRRRMNGTDRGFRFIHMSTDETYGSIETGAFTEDSPYAPNSPYAASKAAGDHLVRAYRVTYGMPTLIARASNTYGPRQYPEKLIPHMIISALKQSPLPVYGQGANVRDWMFVGDLVRGLECVVAQGEPGETYNFAGGEERKNIDTVHALCACLDRRLPLDRSYESMITYVEDRPGHDFRYAMSSDKVARLFGWRPQTGFADGLALTVDWYLQNKRWWQAVFERGYSGARIGRAAN